VQESAHTVQQNWGCSIEDFERRMGNGKTASARSWLSATSRGKGTYPQLRMLWSHDIGQLGNHDATGCG
jgi:hypothetical protein